ncbi:MAG: signal peptidase II [Aquiluna sp.]|nr:signal peptidase II [Aquiluna sp.]
MPKTKGGAKRVLLYLGTAVAVVVVDQLTKFWAEANLTAQSVPVLGEILRFRLAYNDAAAFSLGVGSTWVLSLISIAATIALLIYGPRVKTGYWAVIAGFVLGGAAGNGIDRVFKDPSFMNGHVVDFIQIPYNFPIFNLADSFLVIGVILAVVQTARGDEIGGGRAA